MKPNQEDIKKLNDTISELPEFYRTSKFGDWLLDKIPYGWRMYYRYQDVRHWTIKTYQRLRYGVSDSECWNLSNTITSFVLPRLKHFKKMKRYAYPPDITPEQWEEIIDELIWTFEFMDNDGEELNPFPQVWKKDESLWEYCEREKTEEEKESMNKWQTKQNELHERKRRGLELFAKYYDALWD
jgi:hypothetical protein